MQGLIPGFAGDPSRIIHPSGRADVSPLTIFPSGNLLWLDASGGTYLRTAGDAVPANGEVIATIVDRGNVGNLTSAGGAGVTYLAAGFGSRGAIQLAGGALDYLLSPAWVLSSRVSGIACWRVTEGTVKHWLWNHGAAGSHTSLFWNETGSPYATRAGGGDAGNFPMGINADRWTSFRLQNSGGEVWAQGGYSVSSATAATIPSTSVATMIGARAAASFPYIGYFNQLVLWDGVMSEDQRLALQAWAQATSGLAA